MLNISVSQQGRSALLWYTKYTVFIASFSGSCSRIFFSALKPTTEVWVGKAKEALLWFFFFFGLFLFACVCFIYTHIFVVSMDFSFVVSISLKFAVLMQACPAMAVSMSWKSLGSHTLQKLLQLLTLEGSCPHYEPLVAAAFLQSTCALFPPAWGASSPGDFSFQRVLCMQRAARPEL